MQYNCDRKAIPKLFKYQNNQTPYFVAFFYIIPKSFFSESFIFAQKKYHAIHIRCNRAR